ncbi:hypothetical protein Tco_0524217 [Tanacetum coccineum]
MEISIADQIALDDALVAPADRLKIGKCNLRLSSDITSKEATLQVVYDVLVTEVSVTALKGLKNKKEKSHGPVVAIAQTPPSYSSQKGPVFQNYGDTRISIEFLTPS